MPNGRLALDAHIGFIIIHVEHGLGRILYAPNNDGCNLNRIAALIVDLEFIAVQVAYTQRHLVSRRSPQADRSLHRPFLCNFETPIAASAPVRIERIAPMKSAG